MSAEALLIIVVLLLLASGLVYRWMDLLAARIDHIRASTDLLELELKKGGRV